MRILPIHALAPWRSALAQWGAMLAMVAVVGSLLAPLARLSTEVATGKLGSLCLASAIHGLDAGQAAGLGDPTPKGSSVDPQPCNGCASGLLTPPAARPLGLLPPVNLLLAWAPAEPAAERPSLTLPPGRAPPPAH